MPVAFDPEAPGCVGPASTGISQRRRLRGTTAPGAPRLLLIEDNPRDGAMVIAQLIDVQPRFEIHHATTLSEASRLTCTASHDMVIADLHLPDSSARDTVRQVRAMVGDAPIIVVSDLIDDDLRQRVMRDGATDVIAKNEIASQLFSRSVLYVLERHRARTEHRQLENVLETMPDAILVVTPHGAVRYVNQAATTLFGRGRDELCSERLGFSVMDGETTEISIPIADGHRICEMRVTSIVWQQERAHLAVIRDITERVRAQELRARAAELEAQNRRYEAANRLKTEFVANMSHELRTPLNAVIGFASLLHDGQVGPLSVDQHEFLGDILRSARHLLRLINEILDLAKVEAGKLDFHPEHVVLSRGIAEVVELLRAVSERSRVEIRIECDASIDEVEVDPVRLHQTLYNYLSNALKFSPPGSAVTIRTAAHGEAKFRIDVEDMGIGIPEADLDKLFVEFQQLDAGSAKRYQGTGLGLALTKRLVEAQGGAVAVRSSPGRGSVFSAILPRRAERAVS